jgi:redox-sensitive bicupin YhaK (pirin superfamily)
MSWLTGSAAPDFTNPSALPDIIIEPSLKDLGGFRVRRALPSVKKRMVGPFIFLDHMGPADFAPHTGLDVRPHPHIGLATVTYLIEGSLFHRDTLGSAQDIVPGDVNWMTAGRGIAHSERSSPESRNMARRMTGIQSWVALPKDAEEVAPGFFHHAGATLPSLTDTGIRLHVIAGTAYGEASPVQVFSHTLYADAMLTEGKSLPLPQEHEERAVYLLSGTLGIADEVFEAPRLLIFRPGDHITIRAVTDVRCILLGGEPTDGTRHIWWNFVSSSKERIEQAKADWVAGRFGLIPADDTEFIPLPSQ